MHFFSLWKSSSLLDIYELMKKMSYFVGVFSKKFHLFGWSTKCLFLSNFLSILLWQIQGLHVVFQPISSISYDFWVDCNVTGVGINPCWLAVNISCCTQHSPLLNSMGSRCDHMGVGFTTTYAISAYHHWSCEFESRSGQGVQHYVIKFVSDLLHQ
jgi:hypothetical protein